jgi:hypothetical protein
MIIRYRIDTKLTNEGFMSIETIAPTRRASAGNNGDKAAEEVVFTLRISSELNEKLIAEATVKKRSRAAQIIYMLEQAFEQKEEK